MKPKSLCWTLPLLAVTAAGREPRAGLPRPTPASVVERGGPVTALAFSPDGKTLATGGHDQTVRLWDVPSGRLRATLPGHPAWVAALAFTPDSRTLFEANQNNGYSWPQDQSHPSVEAHQTVFLGGPDGSSIMLPESVGATGQ